jgi:lipopolysaccharide biosynthesis glycosyltransferase
MESPSHINDKMAIYVAFGYDYLVMAILSANSLREYNREISCLLITNQNICSAQLYRFFDIVHFVDNAHDENRNFKISAFSFAERDKCLYIDCDTLVCGSLEPMFKCLDHYDVIIKLNPRPSDKDYNISDDIPGFLFPSWNAGVIFFRKNAAVEKLFEDWGRYFRKMEKRSDQPTLARAFFDNPEIKLLSTNSIWNTFPEERGFLQTKNVRFNSRIFHYRNPEKFPEIAQKIIEIHHTISGQNNTNNPLFLEEIANFENRYRIINSNIYKTKLGRTLISFWIKYIRGKGPRPLGHTRHRSGDRFDNLPSENEH